MVHAHRHISGEIGDFIFTAENWYRGSRRHRVGAFRSSCTGWRWFGNKNPNIVFPLFAGIASGINAVHLELLIGSERRDQLALAIVSVKLPAVVATFNLPSIEVRTGKRHAAMRAGIMQRECAAILVAANDQRQLQQGHFPQLISFYLMAG